MDSQSNNRQLEEISQRLDKIEAKVKSVSMAFTNFLLFVIAVALCSLAAINVSQFISKMDQAEVLRTASLEVGNQLNVLESSYSELVYNDPESKGIYHQLFRVSEFQFEVMKLLAFQNQLLLSSLAGDNEIMRQTALGQYGGNYD